MCGICGQLRFDNINVKSKDLTSMMSKIARRGPDAKGRFIQGRIGLGHQRLSVIDLSSNASQPMLDNNLNLVMVFNGVIYNYKKLTEELISYGYNFFSKSDSEVILKAYHHWGDECVKYLDGMFAFAIWDINKQSLFLARDRVGIKPLYYSINDKYISFASNTQALLTQDLDKDINPVALHQQLSLHGVVAAPNTIINGINKLTPATTVIIDKNAKFKEKTYWNPLAYRAKYDITDVEYIQKTKELLNQAVAKRIDSADVDIGILLSGGIDSSLLVALLHQQGHKNIKTFSIGFEDIEDEIGSEFEYSDQIAKKFNTEHKKYNLDNNSVLQRLPEAVSNMAEPMVSQDAVAFYLISEQVCKDVKVVLSGQGADEVFAGYFWYAKIAQETSKDVNSFLKHYVDIPHSKLLESLNINYQLEDYTYQWINKEFSKSGAQTFMDKVFRTDITRLIVDDPIKRVDNMTMAWGLEARVPFMDTKLIEWALQMPAELKMRENGKYPLRQISKGLLPDNIIYRKKFYFPMPALRYIQGEYLDFMSDILNSLSCIKRSIFNRDYVKKVINSPREHMTALKGSRLFHMALLELWLQKNIDSKN